MVRIGITIGDAAGIGPEVILKTMQTLSDAGYSPIIFGNRAVLEFEDDRLVSSSQNYRSLRDSMRDIQPSQSLRGGEIGIVETSPQLNWDDIPTGRHDARCAHLQYEAFIQALNAVDSGHIDAVVTAPWNKALFKQINKPAVGHTEILAKRYDQPNGRRSVMMLAGPRLRVSLVTTHIPISSVSKHLSQQLIIESITTTANDLIRYFGIVHPKIAVCGLNPHAGENGVMGTEELTIIEPAIQAAQLKLGGNTLVEGPFPADSLFAKFRNNATPYDAVIGMYHDQALIPLKLLHFGESTNITLGLPIVRTSVDHGTAYDIAGKGIADEGSMVYAVKQAAEIVANQRHFSAGSQ